MIRQIQNRLRAKRIQKLKESIRDKETIEFFAELGRTARVKNYQIDTYKMDGKN